ncbi:hypothetical protein ACLOJK_031665 [Asimina triloba]
MINLVGHVDRRVEGGGITEFELGANISMWVGSVGQVRPKTLIASLKAEVAAIEDFDLQAIKDIMKHFINKSLYALGSSLPKAATQANPIMKNLIGLRDGCRDVLRHHDFMLQAAWPELFIDKKGSYWDVPASISLDLATKKSVLRFKKVFGDLTRIDARLDICSGKAYTKGKTEANPLATPQLNVIFHQQILGGLVFRIDSRIDSSSYSPSEKLIPHADDIVYSLCYAVPRMHSGKIVAWYSPERKEGMIELRVFEFERL